MKKLPKAITLCLTILTACASEKPAQPPPIVPEKPVEMSNVRPVEAPSSSAPIAAAPAPRPASGPDPLADDASAKPIGKDEARVLVKALPLKLDAVRFDAIARFVFLFAPYTPNKALLRAVRESVNAANDGMKIPVSTFSLGMQPPEYVGLLKDRTRNYLSVLDAVSNAVARTKDVILDFRERAGDQLDDSQRAAIEAQVGARPSDNSIAFRNLTSLRSLASAGNFTFKSGDSK